jgi:hypothetical protein
VAAFVEDGLAFRLVPYYVDIEQPYEDRQDKYVLAVLKERVDDTRVEEEKEDYPDEVKIWEPIYVHDINDYEVIDQKEKEDRIISDPREKLVKLHAGAVELKVVKSNRNFEIVEVEFETDERGRPVTEEMKEIREEKRREQKRKDQESFRKQFGVSSYQDFPGIGS